MERYIHFVICWPFFVAPFLANIFLSRGEYPMKKVWDIVSTVLVWILVVVAVAMMIFTVVSVNTFDRNDRDLFGFKAFIVRSDSMSKTDFDAGDLILVKEVDPSTLKEGDIITKALAYILDGVVRVLDHIVQECRDYGVVAELELLGHDGGNGYGMDDIGFATLAALTAMCLCCKLIGATNTR